MPLSSCHFLSFGFLSTGIILHFLCYHILVWHTNTLRIHVQENLFLECCSLSSSLSPAIAKVLVSGLPALQSNKYFSENQLLNLKCSVIYFRGEGLHFPSHYVINASCVVWYCLPLCKVQRPVTVKKPSALSKLVCCTIQTPLGIVLAGIVQGKFLREEWRKGKH